MVTTIAGGTSAGYTDGSTTFSSFYNPAGIAIDTNGNLYVADYSNHRIRMIAGMNSDIISIT